ncbi:MAG: hypothetical protein II146_05625, partial [Treponema sp.]|nr:hypothetical protein [Treponema sp.]
HINLLGIKNSYTIVNKNFFQKRKFFGKNFEKFVKKVKNLQKHRGKFRLTYSGFVLEFRKKINKVKLKIAFAIFLTLCYLTPAASGLTQE